MPTDAFNNFAKYLSAIVGSPMAFVVAVVVVMTWMVAGPLFAYSDTWQLAINALGLGPAALGMIEGVTDFSISKRAGGIVGHHVRHKRPLTAVGCLIMALATCGLLMSPA